MNTMAFMAAALFPKARTEGKARKRILLITPENPEIKQVRRSQFNNFTQITMPYLAGFIDEARYQIELVDEYNQRVPYGHSVDLVAITVNTPNATHCYRMAARFRASGAKVVLGGPHATLCPEEVAQHCDHLVVGEAEETWPQFLEDFHRGCARPRYTCERTPSLQGLPIPRRDLIRHRHFTKGAVFATRGCPYACSYCNLKQIYGPGFRTRPVPEVMADIQSMANRYFVFWDDNFFGDRDYAIQLLTALKPLRRRWAAQVSIDRCADDRLLQLARESGCVYLFIGLESFSEASLASVNKGFNRTARYAETIRRIHEHGICVQAGVIFGFDTDTPEVFGKTLESCESLGIDGVTASVLTPLPGTSLHDEMKQTGRLLGDDWTYFNGKTRVAFQPKQMSAEELFAGYMWFRRQFYSYTSMFRRMAVSRTSLLHNLLENLGYKWSLKPARSTAAPDNFIANVKQRLIHMKNALFKRVGWKISNWPHWWMVVIYATAMAWVESAVVFYLRTMIDRIDPHQPDPFPVIGGFGWVELVRELATMVMLLAVGFLAGRNWRARLGYFAMGFGVWDIGYYVFLKAMCGWPHSVLDWDVLFLLPMPWWGPVLAPVLISLLLISWGTLASQFERGAGLALSNWRIWILNFAGVALALYVFMADTLAAAPRGLNAVCSVVPEKFNWPLFGVALFLMGLPVMQSLWQPWSTSDITVESDTDFRSIDAESKT